MREFRTAGSLHSLPVAWDGRKVIWSSALPNEPRTGRPFTTEANDMNQPNLFDPPRARTSDPPTSHLAVDDVMAKLPAAQRAMLTEFREPLTANEAAQRCVDRLSGMHETYRKRKHELYRAGLIEFVTTRKCRQTGRMAEVFQRCH